jgi:hypothetical protein
LIFFSSLPPTLKLSGSVTFLDAVCFERLQVMICNIFEGLS